MCSGLHNPETSLWGRQKRIKMYFHDVYGGGRRRYGGAGRNSLEILVRKNLVFLRLFQGFTYLQSPTY